jgi:hypothetical protein
MDGVHTETKELLPERGNANTLINKPHTFLAGTRNTVDTLTSPMSAQ